MEGFTTAEELNGDAWEPITCLSGRKYAIKRVTPAELVRNGLLSVPGIESLDEIKKKVLAGAQPTEQELAIVRLSENVLLRLGIVSVRIVDMPREKCPPGTVSIDAIAGDRDELLFAVKRKGKFGAEAFAAEETVVSETPHDGESFRAETGAEVHSGEASG